MDPVVSGARRKQKATDDLYVDKLQDYGAEIIYEKCRCSLFLIPVYRYSEQCFQAINKLIVSYKELLAYLRFTCVPEHIEELRKKLPLKVLLAEDIRLLEMSLRQEKKEHILSDVQVIPLSFIYKDYPVFDKKDINIDYLIVLPTRMSFQREPNGVADPLQKRRFVRNINKILDCLDRNDSVVYKLHSVRDGGWPFVGRRMYPVLKCLPRFILRILNKIILFFKLDRRYLKTAELSNTIEFIFMTDKCKNLADITPYSNFPAELFYPNVNKGIITGRSNAVWGALKAGIAVYNCDDNLPGSGYGDFALHLTRNFESFGVMPCQGKLEFDVINFDKVKQDNTVDIIKFLRNKINIS
jgi:hypothetical protein